MLTASVHWPPVTAPRHGVTHQRAATDTHDWTPCRTTSTRSARLRSALSSVGRGPSVRSIRNTGLSSDDNDDEDVEKSQRSASRARCSVSELKPTGVMLRCKCCCWSAMWSQSSSSSAAPRGTRWGCTAAATRRQSATAHLAPPPPRCTAEWAVRHGPQSREITLQAPPPRCQPLDRVTRRSAFASCSASQKKQPPKFDFVFA